MRPEKVVMLLWKVMIPNMNNHHASEKSHDALVKSGYPIPIQNKLVCGKPAALLENID